MVFAIGFFGLIGNIARLFTVHLDVLARVSSLVVWVAAVQPVNGLVFILDGVFIGANDARYLFGAMAIVAFGVYLPAMFIFVDLLELGLVGAWMGYNTLMLGRLITLGRRYRGRAWERSIAAPEATS